ncbi:YetF domain-containing protein [Spirosoma sp. SC4-14]|uniref:DUF421 domain-containing protein n=1 Tax=Spirosoma sp. SC4-14 TaxID=3128900 RepID=UPI0030D100D5
MKKEDIQFDDWQRLLIGNAPAEFLIEVFIRTVLIYLALLIVMRFLGKRMNGQLTNLELAVMLTMGAIISPAMQLPDRGLLSGGLALLCALTFLRGTNLLGFKSHKAEELIQGTATVLVKDGIIQLDKMAENRLSHQQVYAALRSGNVYNLGMVKRLYLEAYGMFSIYPFDRPRPGLSVLPPSDQEMYTMKQQAVESIIVCCNCGFTTEAQAAVEPCSVCHAHMWVKATIDVENE